MSDQNSKPFYKLDGRMLFKQMLIDMKAPDKSCSFSNFEVAFAVCFWFVHSTLSQCHLIYLTFKNNTVLTSNIVTTKLPHSRPVVGFQLGYVSKIIYRKSDSYLEMWHNKIELNFMQTWSKANCRLPVGPRNGGMNIFFLCFFLDIGSYSQLLSQSIIPAVLLCAVF